MKDGNYIDKLFRAALSGHEEKPSSSIWDAIDKQLDKTSVADIKRKYIRLKRIAAVLLVLLMLAGAYTFYSWKTSKELAERYSSWSNEQNIAASASAVSPGKRNKIPVTGNDNEDKSTGDKKTTNTSDKLTTNDEKLNSPNGFKKSPAVINSTGETGDDDLLNTQGGSEMVIDKRLQKTSIRSADYSELQNATVNDFSDNKNENEFIPQLATIPGISPEIPKAEAFKKFIDIIYAGNYILPGNLTAKVLPVKPAKMRKAHSFSATLFFGPDISSNHIKNGDQKNPWGRPGDDDGDKIRKGEQHQFSSTYGVLVDYSLNNHWSLQSGISLSNKSIRIDPKTIYANIDGSGDVKYLYNCSSGYLFLSPKSATPLMVGDSIQAFASTNTLQYVSVPLSVKYNFPLNKINLFTSVGTSVNILTKDKIETGIVSGPDQVVCVTTKINGLRRAFFGGSLSIGATYSISKNFAISFFPSYNFALTSITKDATVNTYPNSINLSAGIRYKL